jgi:hypothetical protein
MDYEFVPRRRRRKGEEGGWADGKGKEALWQFRRRDEGMGKSGDWKLAVFVQDLFPGLPGSNPNLGAG